MEFKQKADRLLHSCGGLYSHTVFIIPMELHKCMSSAKSEEMFQVTQTGMAAWLDTAVRDAVFAAAQGLTTFLTAGGLYSPEENRLTKQLLSHLLRKTV